MTTQTIDRDCVDLKTLAAELEDALPGERFVLRASGCDVDCIFEKDLSKDDAATLTATVLAHEGGSLDCCKAARKAQIDARTNELVCSQFHAFGTDHVAGVKLAGDAIKAEIDAAKTATDLAAVGDDR